MIRRRVAAAGSAVGRGVLVALQAIGRSIGMLEVATLAMAFGAYLLAGAYLPRDAAAGVGLLAGGALSLGCQLLELARPERKP